MDAILEMIGQYGMTAVLMGYFLYKDYKFNTQITSVLGEIKSVLSVISALYGGKIES